MPGDFFAKTGNSVVAAIVIAAIAGRISVIRSQKGKILAGDHPEEAEQFAVAEAPALLE